MTKMVRFSIFWLTLGALFLYSGWAVFSTERAIASGRTVYIELAPVDPRSLIQGDYMRLGYAVPDHINFDHMLDFNNGGEIESIAVQSSSGRLVATIDENHVATFIRLATEKDQSGMLAEQEQLVNYSRGLFGWGNQVTIGTDAYFFQEGTAELFEPAEYGEFKIAADGTPILVGLRDADLNLLGPENK